MGADRTSALTVGQLARAAGVNPQTVRYYERRGLLPEPPRTPAGYRLYPPEAVIRLRFIKQAQELGFSLEEIRDLLALRVDGTTSCPEVQRRTQAKIQQLDARIRRLQAMRAALVDLAAACGRDDLDGECPFLDALERRARAEAP